MDLIPPEFDLGYLTTAEFATRVESQTPVVVLLPVGAIEPHGPHLALVTDVVISQGAAVRAVPLLREHGLDPLIAPPVPYGVTRCASAFRGAVSVSEAALTAFLASVIQGYLDNGVAHVCLVNNHLEPGHDLAIREAAGRFDRPQASVACPLTRRWARTLSREFKSGACHAGEYETAIVMVVDPRLVREESRVGLPEVPVSLSDKLGAGVTDFKEMGLNQAYAGAPGRATVEHGEDQLDKLASMIATEIVEALE